MKKFAGTLIASDMDGTLYDSNREMSGRTREAIAYYVENGGRFTVATGRVWQSFFGIREGLTVNAPVILGNGTMIYDYAADKPVYEAYLPDGAHDAVREIKNGYPSVGMEIYTYRKTYVYSMQEVTHKHVTNLNLDYTEIDDPRAASSPWQKVLITGSNADLVKIKAQLEKKYTQFYYMFSIPVFLEMVPAGVDKGTAVLKLADLIGVAHDKVYTVGDNLNDIDMLKVAAVSFAPSNGHREAVAAADVILPPNDEHTVAALIEYLDKKV